VTGARLRVLGVLGLTLITSVCFVSIKAGLAHAPPLYFGGLRAMIGGFSLLLLARAVGRPLFPARGLWLGTLVLALTTTTITYGGMFLSPGRTGAGIASVLGNVQPLVTVVLAAILLNERVTGAKAVALLLGLSGVALVAYPGFQASGAGFGVGSLLALSASAGAATGSVIAKRLELRAELLAVTGWQFVLGSAPLLAAAAVLEPVERVTWTVEFITILLFLALVGTAFTTAAWFWLLERDDVGRLSLILFVIPVLGLVLAMAIFGERITPGQTLGALLIAVGTLAVLRAARGAGTSR
jgi:drug/metabolite transporter (DMT)-like permease